MGTRWAHQDEAPQPSGDVGSATAKVREPVCECCGGGPHPKDPGRCTGGHMLKGNMAGFNTGHKSVQFMETHSEVRRELISAIIQDAGFSPDDSPPKALELAASGLAQAVLVRDSAYARMVESGGPLTSSGRTRRAFEVWLKSTDRVERHLRMVGLKKAPRAVQTLEEVMADD